MNVAVGQRRSELAEPSIYDDGVYEVRVTARALKVSMPTMYRPMRAGRIPFVVIGCSRRIRCETINKIRREGTAAA
jgi:hypothetical protein